jgi:hypothetical protein
MSNSNAVDLKAQPTEALPIALELMKQLITLSSGVLALSAVFLDRFRVSNPWDYLPLILSWAFLIASLIAVLNVISAMVQSRLKPEREWHTGSARTLGRISKVTFVLGISSFGLFALIATWSTSSMPRDGTAQSLAITNGRGGELRYRLIPDTCVRRLDSAGSSPKSKSVHKP